MKYFFTLLTAALWQLGSALSFAQGTVDHSTGRLGVSIPIYTLTEGNLSVPVTLNYDGAGVAVDAAASGVGVNWQLNAGGYISRQVRGYADESSVKFSPQPGTIDEYKGYLHTGYPTGETFAFLKDLEPDIFTLVLNGRAISFILKKQSGTINAILLNNDVDLDIQVIGGGPVIPVDPCDETKPTAALELQQEADRTGLSSFIITTTDGVKYYFGESTNEREYSFSKNQLEKKEYDLRYAYNVNGVDVSTTPVTWRISRVVYPKTTGTDEFQSITFTYKRSHQRILMNAYDKSSSLISDPCQDLPKITQQTDQYFVYKCDLQSIKGTLTEITINDLSVPVPTNIASIVPSYNDEFDSAVRMDLPLLTLPATINARCRATEQTNYQITRRVIANPFLSDPTKAINQITIKDLTSGKKNGMYLHHSYFDSYIRNIANSTTQIQAFGRLNLKGVYPIKFNDNGTTELIPGYTFGYESGPLPVVTSLARDHWGYYNGQDANATNGTLYNFSGFNSGAPCPQKSTNLDAVLTSAAVGALKYIRLPTGGQQGFDYELHDSYNYAKSISGLRVKSIRNIETISGRESRTNYSYKDKANTGSSGYLAVCPLYGVEKTTYNSNLQEVTNYYVQPDIYATILSRFTYGSYISYENVREEILNESNETTGYTDYEFLNWSDSQNVRNCSLQNGEEGYTNPFTNSPVNACDDGYFGVFRVLTATYPYVPSNPNAPRYAFWQGKVKSVRIYRITSGLAELVQETTYNYSLTEKTECAGLDGGLILAPTRIVIGTNNGSRNPQPILNVLNAGSTITGIGQSALEIFAPSALVAGTALGFASFALSYAVFIIEWLSIFSSTYFVDNTTNYNIGKYKTPMSEIRLLKTINRTFNPSDITAAPIELATEYVYGSTLHKQVTATKTYNIASPESLLTEQTVKYSLDYSTGSCGSNEDIAGIQSLKNRKALIPIEVITKRNGRVTGGQYFQFYGAGNSTKEGLLKAVYALELASPILASSFIMSTADGTACTFSRDANYKLQSRINDYNSRGLAISTNQINQAGVSTVVFNGNNFLPTETKYTAGAKVFSKKYDYQTPLWGVSKITNSDNSTTSYRYDELGRPSAVLDQNNDVLKTYAYNYKTVNYGPAVVGSIPAQYGMAGQLYTYVAPYSLFDYPVGGLSSLVIDPTGLPSWLVVTGNTISGTPPADAIGNSYTIQVKATGSNGSVTTISYVLRISNCLIADPYIVTGTYSSSTPVSFNAVNRIETDSVQQVLVNPNASLILKAGQSVRLKAGFTIKPGASFRAYTGPCN